jgi:RHS repeat-associated protein
MKKTILFLLLLLSFIHNYLLAQVPANSGVAGYTEGYLNITDIGSATYSVPIVCPSGTGGVQPKISLSYNSQGGNGIIGKGWSLIGLSTITRSGKNKAQDGIDKGVDFDSTDTYNLDGERLVAIKGAYGANETEYRTEQTSFSRIISYGNNQGCPDKFKIWTKSGLIMEYGYTEDSRIEVAGKSAVIFWVINKISDTKGNFMTFVYEENRRTNEYVPLSINYTGNEKTGLQPYNSIQFEYSNRSDSIAQFVKGSAVRSTKILSKIKTSYKNEIVRTYNLAYQNTTSTTISQLTSIQECGADGTCFTPTSFKWLSESPVGFKEKKLLVGYNGQNVSLKDTTGIILANDWNTDGINDITFYAKSSKQFFINGAYHSDSTAVYKNRDWAKDSILLFNATSYRSCLSSSGNQINKTNQFIFDGVQSNNEPYFFLKGDSSGYNIFNNLDRYDNRYTNELFFNEQANLLDTNIVKGSNLYFGNFNDDRYNDILVLKKETNSNYIFESSVDAEIDCGDGFSFKEFNFNLRSNNSIPPQYFNNKSVFLKDFNSDGLTDILLYDTLTGKDIFLLKTKDSFDIHQNIFNFPPNGQIYFGNWNDDNLIDILWYDSNTGNTKWLCNKGDGSFLQTYPNINPDLLKGGSCIFLIDLNSDGITDIGWWDKNTGKNRWLLNSGYGKFGAPSIDPINPNIIARNDKFSNIIWGQFDDDGLPDAMWYNTLSGEAKVFTGLISNKNYVETITEGHGKQIALKYLSIYSDSSRVRTDTIQSNLLKTRIAYDVVSEVWNSDGIGSFNKKKYNYSLANIDLEGRGFRGFDVIDITDMATNITEKRLLRPDYKVISDPMTGSETSVNDKPLSRSVMSSKSKDLYGGKVHWGYNARTTTTNYEINNNSVVSTVVSDQEYDNWGNLIKSVVNYGNGNIETTICTYKNDSINWFIGRLLRAEATKQIPNSPDITRISAFEYDDSTGLLLKEIIEPEKDKSIKSEKSYSYDVYGNIVKTIAKAWNGSDVEERVSTVVFDEMGRFAIQKMNDLEHTLFLKYDTKFGNPTEITDPNGLKTTITYDGFGRTEAITQPDGNYKMSIYRKCATGNCPDNAVYFVYEQSSLMPYSLSYFDIMNRTVQTNIPSFNGKRVLEDYKYDFRGNIKTHSDPYFVGDNTQWTTFDYDILGRQVSETLPGNRTTKVTYDGLKTTYINVLNQKKIIEKNAKGQLIKSIDEQSNAVDYRYDASGNMTGIQYGSNRLISFEYDASGRKTAVSDPDMGRYEYKYNAFGELITQLYPKGDTMKMTYDKLGRLKKQQLKEGENLINYDNSNKGIGKISSVKSFNDYATNFQYDDLGRLKSKTEVIESQSFNVSFTYDAKGRLEKTVYPSGFATKNVYNAAGYQSEVRRANDDFIFWKSSTVNAKGQLESFQYGNGVITNRVYDTETDYLKSIVATKQNTSIQDLAYGFDGIGNLVERKNNRHSLTERFTYDNLNRLTSYFIPNKDTIRMSYDILGNILEKSDVGTYTYDPSSNKLISVKGNDSTYCLPSFFTDISYTSFNKAKTLEKDSNRLVLEYGADFQRKIQKQYVNGKLTRTKIYIGGLYEKEIKDSVTREIHYIRSPEGVIAVYNRLSNNQEFVHYWHKDHLGSLQAITDNNGTLVQELAYDAWGARRNPDGTAFRDTANLKYERGFTGHEHYDLFDLVDMNGRIYDPILGRFLSPDPMIQDITDLQNLNRYSYVKNNPLSYTDPSGYFSLKKLFKGVAKVFTAPFKVVGQVISGLGGIIGGKIGEGLQNLGNSINKGAEFVEAKAEQAGQWVSENWKTLAQIGLQIAANALIPGVGSGIIGVLLSGAINATASSLIGSLVNGTPVTLKGVLKAAAIGALTSVASYGQAYAHGVIGDVFGHTTTAMNVGIKALAHGVVGGVSSVIKGDNFFSGFSSGALTSASELGINKISSPSLSVVAASVVGGTNSVLSGGKFANGASTGAFIHLFNECKAGEECSVGNVNDKEAEERMKELQEAGKAVSEQKSLLGKLTKAFSASKSYNDFFYLFFNDFSESTTTVNQETPTN